MLPAQQRPLSLERYRSEAWPALRTEWMRLHAQSEQPTFFLSVRWMDAWLSAYGPSLAPEFLCLRAGDIVTGLLLLTHRRSRRGPFTLRHAYFNSDGEGSDSPVLEHNAVLCRAEDREAVAECLAGAINADPWDEFGLSGLRSVDHELLIARIDGVSETKWRDSPFVDLEALRASGQRYLDSLSSNSRQQVRRSMKLYAERGHLLLETAQDAQQALQWFEEMTTLHEALWQDRGKPGAFASPRQRAFHHALISAGAPGDVQLTRISAGASTIGILYNLWHRGHISYYQSGFRYEDDNRLKPGLVCHALAIQHALDHGAREYDLLAVSDQGARYKTSLANATRRFGWSSCRRQTAKRRAIDAVRAARQRWAR